MKRVYIETSVVSYLTARPTGDLMGAARQKATADWWESQAPRFELCISQVVLAEAGRGSAQASERRLAALAGLICLDVTEAAVSVAERLIMGRALPQKALNDALHVSVAATHEVDYLLTWNYRHIDNAETKPLIREVCASAGFACPEICTPHEFMGVDNDAG